jgi:general stress protein CsbA
MLMKRILAVAVMLVVLLSPFLLLVDFDRFIPVVLTVWLLSAAYFVFIKSRA